MSPEVLRGDGYDFKSDIWSLGCLLYELTMLKSPFKAEGLNLYSLFQKISQGDYQPLPTTYSEDLRSLAYLMISTRSEDRPEIATACVKASALRLSTSNSRKPSLEPIVTEIIEDRDAKDQGYDRNRLEGNPIQGNEGEKTFVKGSRFESVTKKVSEGKETERSEEADGMNKDVGNNGKIAEGAFEADRNMEIDIKMNYDQGTYSQAKNSISRTAHSSNLNTNTKSERKNTEDSESLKPLYIKPNIRSKTVQVEIHDAPDTDSNESPHININTNTDTNTHRDRNRDRQDSGLRNGNSKIRNFSNTKNIKNAGARPVIERNKGFDLADDINPVLCKHLYTCIFHCILISSIFASFYFISDFFYYFNKHHFFYTVHFHYLFFAIFCCVLLNFDPFFYHVLGSFYPQSLFKRRRQQPNRCRRRTSTDTHTEP